MALPRDRLFWRLDPKSRGGPTSRGDLGAWLRLVQFTGREDRRGHGRAPTCCRGASAKGGGLSFGAGAAGRPRPWTFSLDDYAALFLKSTTAPGELHDARRGAPQVEIELQVFGSKESYAWSHVHLQCPLDGTEKATRSSTKSSVLATEETRAMRLAHRAPIGLSRCRVQLFRDYYDALAASAGEALPATFPTSARHEMMCVMTRGRIGRTGRWARIGR